MNNDQPNTNTKTQDVAENKAENSVLKAPSPELQPVSDIATWPGAFGIYKYSKKAIRTNGNTLGIVILLSIVWAFINSIEFQNRGISLIKDIVDTLVNVLFTAAFITIVLAGVNNIKMSISQVFDKIKKYLLNIFIVSILVSFATFASIILFVIPFFFVFPRLIFAPYLVIDKNMKATDAFSASWNMSKGHVGKVYGIVGANIAMGLLAVTIIGIPFAIYFIIMYSAASAILYTFINKNVSVPVAQTESPKSTQSTESPAVPAQTPTSTDSPASEATPKVAATATEAPAAPTTPSPTPASNPPAASTDTPTAPKV